MCLVTFCVWFSRLSILSHKQGKGFSVVIARWLPLLQLLFLLSIKNIAIVEVVDLFAKSTVNAFLPIFTSFSDSHLVSYFSCKWVVNFLITFYTRVIFIETDMFFLLGANLALQLMLILLREYLLLIPDYENDAIMICSELILPKCPYCEPRIIIKPE